MNNRQKVQELRVAVLSTGHLTIEAMILLTLGEYKDLLAFVPPSHEDEDAGLFVHVPESFDYPVDDCVFRLIAWGKQNGYDFIRLSSEGSRVEELDFYNW